MQCRQPLEGVPVHPLGFPAVAVEDAWLPPQLVADSVSFSCRPVIPGFPLAGVGQLVAVPTGEDAAAVEDRHAPTAATGGAEKPWPLPAEITGSQVEIDGIAFIPPIIAAAPVSIGEDHPVRFSAHADGGDYFAMA